MVNVIGIRFQTGGKLYFFDPGETQPKISDKVLVETSRGFELGEVIMPAREVSEESVVAPLRTVIRLATEDDLRHERENKEKEKEAFRICQEKIAANKLEMKLVRAEIGFENNKILFYFTANGRVDFRALVKDLAAVFKTRIELRQIGVRDEARMIGGLGPCGRPICCDAFLDDFEPVSIKMAKEQKLSLNPTKISGVCGRLMCCLKYEEDQYEEVRKRMPKVGKDILTSDGPATVVEQNILKETITCRVRHGDTMENKEFSLDELEAMGVIKPVIQEQKNEKPETNAEPTLDKVCETDEDETEETLPHAVQSMIHAEKSEDSQKEKREPESQKVPSGESKTENGTRAEKQEPIRPEKENRSTQRDTVQLQERQKTPEKPSAAKQADVWRAALEKAMAAANGKHID